MNPADLLARTAVVAEQMAAAERALIGALAELWPVSAWRAAGAHSAIGWLRTTAGLGYRDARRLCRAAELCAAHPVLAEAIADRGVSLHRADVLAQAATNERAPLLTRSITSLVRLARETADDDAFAAAVRFWAERADEELRPSIAAPHRVVLSQSLFGGGRLDAELHPAAFVTVAAAIDAWTQDPDPADAPYRRPLAERRADALDDLAHHTLTGGGSGEDEVAPSRAAGVASIPDGADPAEVASWVDPADRAPLVDDLDLMLETGVEDPLEIARLRIRRSIDQQARRARRAVKPRAGVAATVVVDLHTLAGRGDADDLTGIRCRSERWALTRRAAQQLLCDASLTAALFAGPGRPVDATASTERFTLRQRRLVAARDGGCVFPTCHRPARHCDIHHLRPVARGGPSTLDNAATLCRHHHRLVHHGWVLEPSDDGTWRVTDPAGTAWVDGLPAPPGSARSRGDSRPPGSSRPQGSSDPADSGDPPSSGGPPGPTGRRPLVPAT